MKQSIIIILQTITYTMLCIFIGYQLSQHINKDLNDRKDRQKDAIEYLKLKNEVLRNEIQLLKLQNNEK